MTSLLHTVAFSVCCSSDEVNSERFNHGVTPGGGALSYETDGDARRKIRIKALKETNLGAWFRRYLTPKRDHAKTDSSIV